MAAGDFNYNLLKASKYKVLDILKDHIKLVNKSKHISGSLIPCYIKKKFFTNVIVENVYFLHHYVVRIVIEKDSLHFHINP